MVRRPLRGALAAATASLALSLSSTPAAASTSLVDVVPANGATLAQVPTQAVLTFAAALDPDRSTATVTAPGQPVRDVRTEVDGATLLIDVPAAGEGTYVLGYSVASAADPGQAPVRGEVAFTVTEDGVPHEAGGTTPWAVAGVVAALGMAGALVLLVRRWRALG